MPASHTTLAALAQAKKDDQRRLRTLADQRARAMGLTNAQTAALHLLVNDPEATIPLSLGIDDAALIRLQRAAASLRSRQINPDMFRDALELTQKRISRPRNTPGKPAMHRALDTQAMQLAVRVIVQQARTGTARRRPCGKAPDLVTPIIDALSVITGGGSHFDKSCGDGDRAKVLQSPLGKGLDVPPGWRPSSYGTSLRNLPRVAGPMRHVSCALNIALLRALSQSVPHVGRWLAIDGSKIPAWCRQTPCTAHSDLDRALLRHTPEAGTRFLDKAEPEFWRGYWLVAITDIATGLPVVWRLISASVSETDVTQEMLQELLEAWPDLQPEALVADKGWDSTAICQMLETQYGIHPVIPMRENAGRVLFRDRPALRKASRDGTIIGIEPDGRLICATRNKPCGITSIEGLPSRRDLAPGEVAVGGRVRALCQHTSPGHDDHCGRIALNIRHDHRRLTYFPHHPDGMPERYAMRLALSGRRSHVEGLFNRLKNSLSLGTSDGTRLRLRSRASYDALISMAFLMMSAEAAATLNIDLDPAAVDAALTPTAPPEGEIGDETDAAANDSEDPALLAA